MTREEILSTLRGLNRPEDAKLSDDALLYRTAGELDKVGRLDEFPTLKLEKVRQEADADAYDRSFLGDVKAAAVRGFSNLQQGFNVVQGASDPTNAQDIANAELRIAANPPSKEYQEFQSLPKDSIGQWLGAFAQHPVQIIAETMAESFGASLPAMAGGFLSGAGAAATVAGETQGDLKTKAARAAIGAAIGAGTGSFAVESASKMLDVMRDKGMNPADPDSVVKFFSDPVKVAEAKELGIRRGIPVGLFDGLTAGFAGRFMKPVLAARQAGQAVPLSRIAGATTKEIGLQAIGGATGELGGQLAAGEEIDPRAIFLEGVAEIGSGPSEVFNNIREVRGQKRGGATPTPMTTPTEQATVEPQRAAVHATVPEVNPFFDQVAADQTLSQTAPVPAQQRTVVEQQPDLATEQTKTILRARGVDETTLSTITEDEAQQFIAQTQAPVAEPASQPVAPSAAEQAAITERDDVQSQAEAARRQAEIEAEARASLEDAQPEFTSPEEIRAQQERAAAVQARAAALRGVRIGQQMLLGDESIRDAYRTTEPVSGRRRAMVQEARGQIAAQKADAATRQGTLDFTGLAPQPAPRAAEVAAAQVETSPATPAATPAANNPVMKPVTFNADDSIVELRPGNTSLDRIKERISGRVAAVAFNPDDKSVSLLPLKRNSDGRPLVVVERGAFKKKADLIDAMVQQYADQKGYKRPTIKALVENLAPFTEDGKVNTLQIEKEFKSPEKRAKAIEMAQRALDLGIQTIGKDTYVPLGTYLKENGLVSQFLAITNAQVPAGPQRVNMSFEQFVTRYGVPEENKKTVKPKEFSEKTVVAQAAADNSLPAKRLAQVVEALKGRPLEEINELRRMIAENKADQAEKLQASIDRLVGSTKEDTPSFKFNLAKSALETIGKVEVVEKAAAEQRATPVSSPQPAPISTPAPVASPVKSPEPASTVQALPSPQQEKLPAFSREARAMLDWINSFKTLDQATYESLKDGSYRLPKSLLSDKAFVSQFNQIVKEKISDYEGYKRQKKLTPEEIARIKEQATQLEKQIEQEKENAARGVISDEDLEVEDEGDPFFSDRDPEQYVYERVQPETKQEAREGLRHSDNPSDYLAPKDSELVDRIVYDFQRRGYKVSVSEATSEIKAGGIVSLDKRAVALILDSLANPNRQAVLNALHEITHVVLGEAPKPIQAAIHNVIERTPNGRLAFYENPEADPRVATGEGLTKEQHAIERAVEHLALLNVDREYSRGLIQSVYRAIKEAFLRAAIYLQKSIVGANNTTGALAQAWVNNELGRVLAGDRQVFDSFLSKFGVKPTFAEAFRLVHDERDRLVAVKVDIDNRGVMFMPAADIDAVGHNIEAAFEETKRTAQANGTWNAARDAAFLKQLFGEDVLTAEEPGTMRRLEPDFQQYNSSLAVQKALKEAQAAQAVANSVHPIIESLFQRIKSVSPELSDAQRAALKRQGIVAPAAISTVEDTYKLLGVVDYRTRGAKGISTLADVLQSEFGVKIDPTKKPLFDYSVTVDKLTGTAASHADVMMATEFKKLRNTIANRLRALGDNITELETNEERNRATIRSAMDALSDAKATRRVLNQSIAEYFRQISRDIRRRERLGVRYGQAAGILEALEGSEKSKTIAARYTDKLLGSIEIGELPLNSIWKSLDDTVRKAGLVLSESDVASIRDAVINEVRMNSDSPLAGLVSLGEGPMAADRGTALLTALINFSKNERFTSEVLRIQMMQGEEKAKAINELRAIYKEGSERVLSDLTDQVKDVSRPTADYAKLGERPTMTESAAQKLLNARDEALSEQARLSKARRDRAVLESARDVFNQLERVAEQRLQIGSNFNVADGANYIDAGAVTDADEVLLEKAKSNRLVFEGKDGVKPEQMWAIIHRNEAWVDARKSDPSKQGRVFWSLVRQNAEMRRFLVGEKVREFQGGLLHYAMMGVNEVFLRTGTRAGERIAKAFTESVGWMRKHNALAEINGKLFEEARAKFEETSGAYRETFKDLFYDPAIYFMQKFDGTEREAMVELARRFREDPVTNQYWSKPGAAEAFTEVMYRIKAGIRLQSDLMATTGANRVEDERIKGDNAFSGERGAMERRQIETGVTGYTTYRFIKDDLKNWATSFAKNVEGDSNPFMGLTLKLSLESGTEQLRARLNSVFDERAWQVFLTPMLRNEDGGVPGPKRSDGVRSVVSSKVAMDAIDASRRDLIALADSIYDKLGKKDDKEARVEYRKEFLGWVNRRWQAVRNMTEETVSVDNTKLRAPSLGIDARTAEFMPQEWVTFPQFTPEDHRKASHAITMTGAFGRNMRVLRDGIAEIQDSIRIRRNELGSLKDKPLSDPEWQALKRTDKNEYNRLRRIAEYNPPAFANIVGDILNTEHDMWTESHFAREAFGAATVGMVSGLKSAVKNLVSTSNLFLVQRSASPEVYKTVAGAYLKTGKLFLGSISQLFGVDMYKTQPLLQAMVKAGVMDAQNHITFRQNITGERGVNDSITGFARALRITRSVFTNTTLSPVKGGTAPALRLVNPFQYTQQLVNLSNTWQLLETYYDMAHKGAAVYRANPNETRLLTHEDVGMSDKTAFEARRQLLLDNGTSIEEFAQDVAKGKNPFNDRAIMAVNNISTTLLANEASVINRPLYTTRSKTGQMAGTFVGWSLDQTNRVLKLLETPEGRVNVEAMLRGMAVLGLTMLPASLAYAALLDKWDELVEKKSNRRAVTEGLSAVPEALASVGTLGLVGDFIDYGASMRQGSSGYNDALSLDNRIVFVSSVRAAAQGVRNLIATGEEANYANVFRPMLQAAGAGGILQNAYILDKITGNALQDVPGVGGVLKAEAGLALRTNMYNYLRAAGREAGLEVRNQQGGSGYTLTKLSPNITDMVIAALQNDRAAFQQAYRDAIAEARAENYLDPLKKVQQLYASRHPYKILFNGTPTAAEVVRMRAVMGENGAAAVAQGLRNFDSYGASLGIAPFSGSTNMSEAQMRRFITRTKENGSDLMGDIMDRARSLRSDDSDF